MNEQRRVEIKGLYYVCGRMRTFQKLTDKGFKPVKEDKDLKNPNRIVWLYLNTKELEEAVNEILNERR